MESRLQAAPTSRTFGLGSKADSATARHQAVAPGVKTAARSPTRRIGPSPILALGSLELHSTETTVEAYGYHTGMCPEADRASAETVNLPAHPRADAATVRKSVDFIVGIGPAQAR